MAEETKPAVNPLTAMSTAPTGPSNPAKPCPPQVLELVEHLRSTGTGQSKLEMITELGKVTKDLNEFLDMLPNNIPPQTMMKVDEYLGKAVTEKEEKDTGKKTKEGWLKTERGKSLQKSHKEAKLRAEGKGETRTETKDEFQSSITEHTVITQSKAPQLRKEGSSQSKQLWADVEVSASEVPEQPEGEGQGEEGEGEAEQKSEVADLNVEEAKDLISRMRSKDKLRGIANADKRKSVKEAAEAQINKLDGNSEEEEE